MSNIDHSSRGHAILSASSSARWLSCPPSAVAALAYPPQDTVFTQEGTQAHEVAEMVAAFRLLHGKEPGKWPEAVDKDMLRHAEEYTDYIQSLMESENDTIYLETKIDFSDWVPNGFGTADCLIISDNKIKVIDYKYGKGVPVSAIGNPQMRLYALGAYSLLSDLFDFSTIEMHIFQPRLDNISVDEIVVLELLEWANSTVKPAAELAAKGKGSHNPGAWCRWCPHAGKCRGLAKVCMDSVKVNGKAHKVERLAPFEVAEVLEMEPLITSWLKSVKAQALTDMLNGEQVPGYKVVEGRAGARKWRDEGEFESCMIANGFTYEDYTKREVLSPTDMDKVLGKKEAEKLLGHLITRAPGSPTIVVESDKRPAYDRRAEAVKDFEGD